MAPSLYIYESKCYGRVRCARDLRLEDLGEGVAWRGVSTTSGQDISGGLVSHPVSPSSVVAEELD
jgi:hypothetical protein